MRFVPLLFSIFFCFSLGSIGVPLAFGDVDSSSVTEVARKHWQKYFAGEPIDISEPGTLIKILHYDPKCSASVEKTAALTEQYGIAAAHSKSKEATQARTQIEQIITDLRSNQPDCVQDAQHMYILGSAYAATNPELDDMICPMSSYGCDYSEFRALPLVVAALLNQGQIRILDEKTRVKMGSIWTEKSPENPAEYLTSGAYRCEDTQIWIDPSAPPIDLAGLLLHELGHLARDKFNFEAWTDFLPKLPNGKMDWKTINILDETASILNSAVFQKQIQSIYYFNAKARWNNNRTTLDSIQAAFWKIKGSSFDIKDDISLYDKQGAVAQVWNALSRGAGAMPPDRNMMSAFLSGDSAVEGLQYHSIVKVASTARSQLSKRVGEAYYANDNWAEPISPLNVSYWNIFYEFWLPGAEFNLMPFLYIRKETRKDTSGKHVFWSKPTEQVLNFRHVLNMASILENLDRLFEQVPKVSTLCQQYNNDLENGYSDGYLGGDSGHPGEKGTKGGEKGTKGAEFGIKACLYIRGGI